MNILIYCNIVASTDDISVAETLMVLLKLTWISACTHAYP